MASKLGRNFAFFSGNRQRLMRDWKYENEVNRNLQKAMQIPLVRREFLMDFSDDIKPIFIWKGLFQANLCR